MSRIPQLKCRAFAQTIKSINKLVILVPSVLEAEGSQEDYVLGIFQLFRALIYEMRRIQRWLPLWPPPHQFLLVLASVARLSCN